MSSNRLRLVENLPRIGKKNGCRILGRKPFWECPHGKNDDIKMDVKDIGFEDRVWNGCMGVKLGLSH
jgi:hypothetical protein